MAKGKKTPKASAKRPSAKKKSTVKRTAKSGSSKSGRSKSGTGTSRASKTTSTRSSRAAKKPAKAVTSGTAKPSPSRKPLKGKVPAGTKERLESERADLEQQLADLDRRRHEREQDGTNYADEFADAETETIERERELSLSENLRDLLDQIEHALQRIAEGTYGICESCGKRIDAARLKALPYASLCIDCKRRQERRG